MSTKLYTLGDLIDELGSTRQRVHDWSQRSQEKNLYIEPDYVAGRANQKGECLVKLWSESQLEEIAENFAKYEEKKAKWHKDRQLKAESLTGYQQKRAEDMRRFRAKHREKKKAQVLTDEFDDKDRETRAMQFLIEKGLV